MSIYERLLAPENLNYAWGKAKNLYRMADGFVDHGEIASFEIDLERRLLEIRRQFEKGSYRLKKLRPLPRPKKLANEKAVNRQYYHVAIEDQVAWIAIVNALGPELDQKMEPWSYGNRLYRPAWYEKDEESNSTLEIGPYRHASGFLYRKFQHSWPLFRRHVALTARMMVLRRVLRSDEMDEPDNLAAISAQHANLAYFRPGFWQQIVGKRPKNDLYHASIDLKQFYPSISLDAVVRGLSDAGAMNDKRIASLVASMLNFQIDHTGMPNSALDDVEPPFFKSSIKGIPTGLFVSGFLANAAMLHVDRMVANKLESQHDVAHFRFVDDHTIISYDFDVLCEWLLWYEQLLISQEVGASVNDEKYDPPSLGHWVKQLKTGKSLADLKQEHANAYSVAASDAWLDGKNPTKLLTKTLAQVSAIAATDIHVLDDEDLDERLKMLEWLLLADIPEREIRPDTRAAFAAGQIASLVPVLVQEADGLVNAARDVALFKLGRPKPKRSTEAELQAYDEELAQKEAHLAECMQRHENEERSLLRRCFALLLQSLREHPGKARLFYRAHQYCRVTGHHGLRDIADWLTETRDAGRYVWADYYVGLSLQIIAEGLPATARRLLALDSLQSDIEAALSHLEDVASIDINVFQIPPARETWFQKIGRQEFGVALIQIAEMLVGHPNYEALAHKFAALSQKFVAASPGVSSDTWMKATGRTAAVWAHLAEDRLSDGVQPSAAWSALASDFTFKERIDRQAARRYPEYLPVAGWTYLLTSDPLPENDSAWVSEVIGDDASKREAAMGTGKVAFTRAARSLTKPSNKWMTILEWTKSVQVCSPFDPRRGEWTALEIVAQLLEDSTTVGGNETDLERLHPNNVLLPRSWIDQFPCNRGSTSVNWDEWRHFAQGKSGPDERAQLRKSATSLHDYRYTITSRAGIPIPDAERRLLSVGRLLLGILRNDHSTLRIWNIRGNELVFPLPKARWFQALAISSPTTLILEACLGARPAETRAITREPGLFGWKDGEYPNDATFDPPLVYGPTQLLQAIRHTQKILEDNQLAVSRNQPRQLIPFRLTDFAASAADVNPLDDGGQDGQ